MLSHQEKILFFVGRFADGMAAQLYKFSQIAKICVVHIAVSMAQ